MTDQHTPQWAQIARFEPYPGSLGHWWVVIATSSGEHRSVYTDNFVRNTLGLDPTQPINPMLLHGPVDDRYYRVLHPDGATMTMLPIDNLRERGWHVPDPAPTAEDAARVLERYESANVLHAGDSAVIEEALRRMAEGKAQDGAPPLHPRLPNGTPVHIGDRLVFAHPDRSDENVVIQVASLHFDSTDYGDGEGPLGWVVGDKDDPTFEFPLDEVIRSAEGGDR